ncbi:MAG: HAMP domain-containing sensor histidine kinase [Blastocatellia bacterium]|nr:HAMP domain-containing sensor histidine kinase [Blastocatellia bacterium]
MIEKSGNQQEDDAMLRETGRLTSRLIHDFKNQLGGMKLYATFLKKRFAENAEGVEVAEKIIQGLNEMAEQAAWVSKLTRPIEVRRENGDLAQFVEMVLSSLKAQAAAKTVEIGMETASEPMPFRFDLQQMQVALSSILVRAIDVSPAGAEIRVRLRRADEAIRIEIPDAGETLDAERLRGFFDFLTHERLNRTSLGLAFAKRILELHGGEVVALPGEPVGTVVEILLRD